MTTVRSVQILGIPFVMSACADLVDVVDNQSSDIEISPSASVYQWDGEAASLVIEATLINRGTSELFARIGDAFGTTDNRRLYVASGSDAYLEQRVSGGWVPTDRATLIEGVSVVPLLPETTYTLVAFQRDRQQLGTFRLRVEYATDQTGTWAGESWSAPFEIR